MREHAGSGVDTRYEYRTANEIGDWESRCPIKNFVAKLITCGTMSSSEVDLLKTDIKRRIELAFKRALEAPFPDPSEVCKNVYAATS
jgi:pyruvate dehydrogenase E1 component alpha subunit